MSEPNSKQFTTEDVQWVVWSDLSTMVTLFCGALHGLVAFYAVITFSWNHQVWGTFLLPPFIGCLVSGIMTAILLQRTKWRQALLIGASSGVVALFLCLSIWQINLLIDVMAVFGIVGSAALNLPYILRIDVSEGCILNLKIYTAISLFAVVIYLVNDIQVATAKTVLNTGLIVSISVGILACELALARHVQALSTKLSQRGVLLSGAGVLTLAVLIGSLGPIAGFLAVFAIGAVMVFTLGPILVPVIRWFFQVLTKMLKLKKHNQPKPRVSSGHTKNWHPTQLPQHITEHWVIWALILLAILAAIIVFLLRRRKVDEVAQKKDGKNIAGTTIRRDKVIDSFIFEKTNDTVRKRYQSRLRTLHQKGVTIGRAESPRELLARLPKDIRQNTDPELTNSYEQTRYGPKS